MSAMAHQPTGVAFDVVLLLHVACVVAGVVTMVAAATTAAHLGRLVAATSPLPEALRRYFRPGFNWAGRSVYGIPAFGVALVGMSRGAYAFSDAWVLTGVGLFVAVALIGEGVVWPAERRLQAALISEEGIAGGRHRVSVASDARSMARGGVASLILLLAGTVVMMAQP
jgi:hypothetical protein